MTQDTLSMCGGANTELYKVTYFIRQYITFIFYMHSGKTSQTCDRTTFWMQVFWVKRKKGWQGHAYCCCIGTYSTTAQPKKEHEILRIDLWTQTARWTEELHCVFKERRFDRPHGLTKGHSEEQHWHAIKRVPIYVYFLDRVYRRKKK